MKATGLDFSLTGCHTINEISRFYLPTKSPDKNLSCVMHKLYDFVVLSAYFVGRDRACSVLNDFVGRLFVYRST